jgi:hypothetical protein
VRDLVAAALIAFAKILVIDAVFADAQFHARSSLRWCRS